jgi:hypothetical protein
LPGDIRDRLMCVWADSGSVEEDDNQYLLASR